VDRKKTLNRLENVSILPDVYVDSSFTFVSLLFLFCFCQFIVDPAQYILSSLNKFLHLVSCVCLPRFAGGDGYNRVSGQCRAHRVSPQTWSTVDVAGEHGLLRSVVSATWSIRLPVHHSLNTNRRRHLPDPYMDTTVTVRSSVFRQCDSRTDAMDSCY
jgi:hypothetical protein